MSFQFTHPGKGATVHGLQVSLNSYVSIHAPWEGCDFIPRGGAHQGAVSIHAPWEGCDQPLVATSWQGQCFNSRTPGGVRPCAWYRLSQGTSFQFTHPGRGATDSLARRVGRARVSIHAPREGCDSSTSPVSSYPSRFNSRTPGGVRRATRPEHHIISIIVSIHAPREGCDVAMSYTIYPIKSFNSRTPGGVRLSASPFSYAIINSFNSRTPGGVRHRELVATYLDVMFQFTHPGRGAT